MLKLRPYQEEAVQAVLAAWDSGRGGHRMLVSLPSGTGNSLVIAAVAKHFHYERVRSIVLVNRSAQVRRMAHKLRYVYGQAEVGVVRGPDDEPDAQVIVASVQTLLQPDRLRRVQRRGRFGLVFADGAHHYVSKHYRRVLESFGVFRPDGPLLLGVSSTPERADPAALSSLFERLVYRRGLPEMMLAGYLPDLRGVQVEASLDLSRARATAADGSRSDFDDRVLSDLLNTPAFNNLVVRTIRQLAPDRQSLVFACSITHAEDLAFRLRLAGTPSAVVHSRLPDKDLAERLHAFGERRVRVLCSVDMLAEGFEDPQVSAVFVCRPTQSVGLYKDMIGRGMHPTPGKTECLVVDFADHQRDGVQTLAALFGLPTAAIKAHAGSVLEALRMAAEAPQAKETAPPSPALRWLSLDDGVQLLVGGDAGNLYLVPTDGGYLVVAMRERTLTELAPRPLDLSFAQGVAEDHLRGQRGQRLAQADAQWRQRPASERQLEELHRHGVATHPEMTKGEASDALSIFYARQALPQVLGRKLPDRAATLPPPAPKSGGIGLPTPRTKAPAAEPPRQSTLTGL